MQNTKEILTVKEVAAILGTSHDTVLRLIADGTLTARPNRPGTARRHWRVARIELSKLLTAIDAIDANEQKSS
jgi:excisionase family DNA binding protein